MYYIPLVVNQFKGNPESYYNTSYNPKSPQGNRDQRERLRISSVNNTPYYQQQQQLPYSYSTQRADLKSERNLFFKKIWREQSAQPLQDTQKQQKKLKKKKKKQNKNENVKKASEFSENLRQKHLQLTFSESFYKLGDNQSKNKKPYLYQSFTHSPAWGVSSATLRHTSHSFHFPKDERFPEKRQQSTDKLAQQIQIPSTLNKKACSLGKGVKQYVHLYELKRNVENPPPGRYEISTNNNNNNSDSILNISFGTQEKFFQIDTTKKYPGPGTYQTREIPGKDKNAFSLRGQLKRFYEVNMQKDIPSCDKYYPQKSSLVQPSRYENITFGKGQKTDFATINGVPGPGQYPNHSKFDQLTTNNKTYQILRKGRYHKTRNQQIQNDILIDFNNNTNIHDTNETDQNFSTHQIETFIHNKQFFLKDKAQEALQSCEFIE